MTQIQQDVFRKGMYPPSPRLPPEKCQPRKLSGQEGATNPEWITAKYAKYAKTDLPLFAFFAWFAVKSLSLAPFRGKSIQISDHEQLAANGAACQTRPIKANQG
ncbi:MAG: hypothetical protein ABSC18_05425 [Verrucomicrobiota bacterium]|jgi:hypothetical protein